LSQRKEEEARQSYEHTTEKEEETRVPAHLLNGTLDPVASDVLLPPGIHQLERAPTEAHLVSSFFPLCRSTSQSCVFWRHHKASHPYCFLILSETIDNQPNARLERARPPVSPKSIKWTF
jgi:hypothetical protein